MDPHNWRLYQRARCAIGRGSIGATGFRVSNVTARLHPDAPDGWELEENELFSFMPRLPLYTCALGAGGGLRWSEAAGRPWPTSVDPWRPPRAQRRREKTSTSEAANIVIVAAFGTGNCTLVAIATSGLTNLHRNIDSFTASHHIFRY